MKKENLKQNLLYFIEHSTCAFTCVSYLKEILEKEGFQELEEQDEWDLKEGSYYVTRNDASLIAFKIPKKKETFHIITTHCDTPALLLKPKGERINEGYLQYNIMPYGGLLNYGWLDHPLSLAGRVFIKKGNKIKKRIIDFQKTMAVVPSVAIHQNDKANSNLDLNMQMDLQPIFDIAKEKENWYKLIESEIIKDKNETILDYDFFLYNNQKPEVFGKDENILLSPRIDNITSVSASLESFLESDANHINVFCTFNDEEIGSLTKEGAESDFLLDSLKRIAGAFDMDIVSTLSKSFIISSDNTHAVHPNHKEFMDDTGCAYFHQGFSIVKEISSTTDAYFSSILKQICDENHIKYQDTTAKNDLAGGSTLSGLSLRHVSVTSIDVGLPELAMHSSMEVCSLVDYYSLYEMMKSFYNTDIIVKENETEIIHQKK